MTDTQTQALAKIDEGAKAKGFGNVAAAMKDFIATALRDFIRQDAEFAQAVVQGGSFAECMAAVAKGVAETANARVKALAAERDKTAAERKAKAKHEKLEKKLTAATQELEAYKDGDNKELEQSRARAAALEKELAEERERARKAAELQDADVSAFGVHFVNVQRDFNDLLVALNKVRAAAPETGEKLTSAVRALVEKIGGTL